MPRLCHLFPFNLLQIGLLDPWVFIYKIGKYQLSFQALEIKKIILKVTTIEKDGFCKEL